MSIVTYEFQDVQRLESEALGEPGKRTFRLVAENPGGLAIMWAEKQHLQGLALAIEQLLDATRDATTAEPAVVDPLLSTTPIPAVKGGSSSTGVRTTLMMRVDRFELGVDQRDHSFLLMAHDMETPQAAPHTFSCRPSRAGLIDLASNITRVAAAGRPRCAICGQPIEQGVPHNHERTDV